MIATKPRIRRSRDESRQLILQAAEALLRQNGPDAVNVRAVAAKVGLTTLRSTTISVRGRNCSRRCCVTAVGG